jgi:hypothetical protein
VENKNIASKKDQICISNSYNNNSQIFNENEHKGVTSQTFQQHEEIIIHSMTERECSFIEEISVADSTVIAEENKEEGVIVNISNLEISHSMFQKNKKSSILQSETKLLNKNDYETSGKPISDSDFFTQHNISKNDSKLKKKPFSRKKKILCFIIFLFTFVILSIILYLIIK